MVVWDANDSSERLRIELRDFIKKWIALTPYKNRLPKKHIIVGLQGDDFPAGIHVVIITAADTSRSWIYTPGSGTYANVGLVDEFHGIMILVKADDKSGGRKSVSSVMSVIKSLLECIPGTTEKTELISRGIYNLFESQEGLIVDEGDDDLGGVLKKQTLNQECSTTRLIK